MAPCKYHFSATAGTIFHDSHLPLMKWFAAIYLLSESKKGMSANQLKRTLKVAYKTVWYLCHRIREAVTDADLHIASEHSRMRRDLCSAKPKNMHKAKLAKLRKGGLGDSYDIKQSYLVRLSVAARFALRSVEDSQPAKSFTPSLKISWRTKRL